MVMATTEVKHITRSEMVQGVLNGSEYCAMLLAATINAGSASDVVMEVGADAVVKGEAFDAIQDGFAVFVDGRARGLV